MVFPSVCRKCKGTQMKSRKNYSHGTKSKAMVTLTCKRCGSTDVETHSDDRRGGRFRRR